MTFVATWEAVSQVGAIPRPADVSANDYGLDPEAAEDAVTSDVVAIMPVDIFGQLADIVALEQVASRHGLTLLEDACEAHGAERDGLARKAVATLRRLLVLPVEEPRRDGDAGALMTDDQASP